MNYALVDPSLQRLAAIKVAIMMWNQDDTRALISQGTQTGIGYYFQRYSEINEEYSRFYCQLVGNFMIPKVELEKMHRRREKWKIAEDSVKESVLRLFLPEFHKKQIVDFIQPIGLEIMNWDRYHELHFSLSVGECMDKLHWTAQGTIDERQTAEQLVRDKNLSVTQRYKLACVYCLEDYAYSLWGQLSGEEFHGKDLQKIKKFEVPLIVYWSHVIEGNLSELRHWSRGISLERISKIASSGNRTATTYFIEKLASKEKRALYSVIEAVLWCHGHSACENKEIPPRHYTEILCLLLPLIDEKQLLRIFEYYPCGLLACFLDWPWQDKFIDILQHVWTFLRASDFYLLIFRIYKKMKHGYTDYDYHSLFSIVWKRGSDDHKKFAASENSSTYFSEELFWQTLFMSGSEESINLILQVLTSKEKESLIFCYVGMQICRGLVQDDNWCLLRWFIVECVPSTKINQFKAKFMNYITNIYFDRGYPISEGWLDKLFSMWDSIDVE